MPFEKPAIVIDNGSHTIKAGFSCDNHPVSMFRNVVGRPSYLNGRYGRDYYDVYVGDSAVANDEDLDLCCPVINGQIINWDNMERIWHHIFYRELKAAPEDRAVMLACSPNSSLSEKIKCCEIFFETLNSPDLCIQPQCVLSLYGSGLTTGICVDIGYDNATVTPIYEGGLIRYAQIQTHLGGNHISKYIQRHLQDENLNYSSKNTEIVETIQKECLDINTETAKIPTGNCRLKLPDGNEIDVGQEVFSAGEIVFQPELEPREFGEICGPLPLHKAVTTSVLKCDSDLRPELYDSVILCGGSSLIPGLGQRLSAEIENLNEGPATVLTSSEGYAVAWLGGAVFTSLPESKQVWITKNKYEEFGEKIIKNKFS